MTQKQTWIDTYLGRYKWYRKLRKGTWYKRSFKVRAYELKLKSYSDYWTRYGGKSSYCEVVVTEYYEPLNQNKMKEINIDKWGKDNWYIFPTFCYHKGWKILTFHFLKFTFKICF